MVKINGEGKENSGIDGIVTSRLSQGLVPKCCLLHRRIIMT